MSFQLYELRKPRSSQTSEEDFSLPATNAANSTNMESVQPNRPPAFINGLTRLPRELVHRVLDDLPLIKVLQIISHKIAYLDECILSHLGYRRVFPSQREIDGK